MFRCNDESRTKIFKNSSILRHNACLGERREWKNPTSNFAARSTKHDTVLRNERVKQGKLGPKHCKKLNQMRKLNLLTQSMRDEKSHCNF